MTYIDKTPFHNIYFSEVLEKNEAKILQEQSENGNGKMICYDVASGIQISYNDLNMGSCYRPIIPEQDFLQIDHCLEGCYECESADGTVTFLGEGDLSVGSLYEGKQTIIGSNIPLKKYKGITVLFEIEKAQKAISENFGQADIDLKKIRDTLCSNGTLLLVKSKREIDHIFGELYSVDKRIQSPYFWIKTIELLLFLSLLDGTAMQKPQHFSEDISKRTQKVYQYIIENPFDIKTIADLSEEFGIAESSLKRCFKSIAGKSIGTFIKVKRIEAAAEMLITEPHLNIGEIAYAAGYENQSKFSAAFKSVMGITPQAYRYKYA